MENAMPDWLKKLRAANDRIVDRLHRADTSWVVRHAGEVFRNTVSRSPEERALSSPARQVLHLIGLTAATPQDASDDLMPNEWLEVISDLESVYQQYNFFFLPDPVEYPNASRAWWQAAETAGPVFLDYFNTLPLLYPEQWADRIRRWFGPFDEMIRQALSLNLNEALEVIDHIDDRFTSQLSGAIEAKRSVLEAVREKSQDAFEKSIKDLSRALEPLYIISRAELAAVFGDRVADAFVELMGLRRGGAEYYYPTELNPALLRPLLWIDADQLGCVSPGFLRPALRSSLENLLLASDYREQFLKHRARAVATQAAQVLRRNLPAEAEIWEEVYETALSHYEHDILVRVGNRYLAVEVKATPPSEPFRDPERAYERLRRDFHGDTGIQRAFDQARRLKGLLLDGGSVDLYTKRGNMLASLPAQEREVHCLCVTADSFGALATDLSLLLEKSAEEPYPWVVSVTDLESTLDAFRELGKGFNDFWEFLDGRSVLHGRVSGSDELEFVGAFLRLGGFDQLISQPVDEVVLAADFSDIFDELDAARRGRGPMPEAGSATAKDVTRPPDAAVFGEYFDGLKKSLAKVGRNERCPCGSGKKFKRCHGRLHRRLPM